MVLALALTLAGCGADVGIISSEDGPTGIITGTKVDQHEEAANGQEALPEETEPASGLDATIGEDEEPDIDPGTVSGEEEQLYEDGLPEDDGAAIDENGTYNSAEDVSLYLYTFGHLPENYITKNEARNLGWSGGSVEKYAPGCAIGGDTFGNREGVLPKGKYHECDIDTIGENSRGAKRLVYSDDGRIYYTEDHYETFILLDGEE
ncbi:MAG: ribonuclease [Oscillospiraceae bacterium]|nr:ribonuclease [Oscillospiraceae bacterium]